jgi:hypothetical protein
VVTPRKPGARRGRPPVAWTKDPHRYAVALLDALLAFEMASERQCALLAAAIMLGERVEKISLDALNRHPGMIGEAYDKAFGSGESTATFEGRAATLRQKYRAKCNPATAQWRIAMAGIFMLVIGAKDREKVKREALARAAEIGEEVFVRDVLLLNF